MPAPLLIVLQADLVDCEASVQDYKWWCTAMNQVEAVDEAPRGSPSEEENFTRAAGPSMHAKQKNRFLGETKTTDFRDGDATRTCGRHSSILKRDMGSRPHAAWSARMYAIISIAIRLKAYRLVYRALLISLTGR